MIKSNKKLNDYRKDGRLAYSSFIKNNGKRITQVNKKTKDRNFKYSRLRQEYLETHPLCEFPMCVQPATEIHHKKGRIGQNMWIHWMSICTEHHYYIHNNPAESYEKGWLLK